MTIWKFRPNEREQGINALYEALSGPAYSQKGFVGSVTLLSQDNDGMVTTISLWEIEETRADSEHLFKKAYEISQKSLTGSPEIKNFRVYSAELNIGLQR